MGRGRIITVFTVASAVLMLTSVLLAASSQNRLNEVFGGVFAPIFSYESPVASVGSIKLYRRDAYMLRLVARLSGISGGDSTGSDYTDDEALDMLIDQTLLAGSASDNGVSPDPEALDEALAPLYTALETEAGGALRDAYKTEFARSYGAFDSDLRNAAERGLTVRVFLLSLYYTATAQGMVSSDLDETQAIGMLRDKLLIKLHVETDIKKYNDE